MCIDMYDQQNAFLSISKSKASQTASDLVPPLASKIAANFVSCACFTIYCADGETYFMLHCGVFAGLTLHCARVGPHFQQTDHENEIGGQALA